MSAVITAPHFIIALFRVHGYKDESTYFGHYSVEHHRQMSHLNKDSYQI